MNSHMNTAYVLRRRSRRPQNGQVLLGFLRWREH